ncbi:MAG: BMP family ABC transporter substrate-binding protein [Chloroflexota bacterium]
MSKKLFFILTLIMIASLALTACGGGAADDDCTSEDVLCIGFVTDVGEVDDGGFNQSGWEAVQQAGEENSAQVDYIETKDAKDYATNMQLFIDDGYDIIVTSGFGMGVATEEAARANPDVYFIGVDQFQGWEYDGDDATNVSNLTGLIFHEDISGFLAGALAAMLSETNVIAGVYGTDLVPPVVAFKEGYEAGAVYINADITVISTYHPGGMDVAFTDPEFGATTAAQAIDNGADVVFGAGGKTGNGALIEAAGHDGLYCIGVDTDQWLTVPEAQPCLVSSAMKLIIPGVVGLINDHVAGNTQSGNQYGPAGLASFHDFDATVPADVKSRLEEIDAGLADGSITTGYGQ